MPCPDGRFTAEMFESAMKSLDLWRVGFCTYGAPMGELVVGTLLYGAISLNIFLRTGSTIIPLVLVLILGATILAQTLAIISTFAGLIILIVPPVIMGVLVFLADRRG